ncbi:F-box protein: endocytic membrane traffic, recycling ReCYcling 1 [Tilletia horrida]|nr:F-box protein: endocytic membrane traffic, recycling ReCYcling 1 [Tilletia horrida]KAK0568737.1 F-box protein: endocytic membrane traffic, recycling ReCYcling 1 [Tilletia horrida]
MDGLSWQPIAPIRRSLQQPRPSSISAYNPPPAFSTSQPRLTSLPAPILARILSHLPIPDIAAAAQTHTSLAKASADSALWDQKEAALQWQPVAFFQQQLTTLSAPKEASASTSSPSSSQAQTQPAPAPAPQQAEQDDDDDGFGDFEDATTAAPPATSNSFFDVDLFSTPIQKLPTVTGGAQVIFNATPAPQSYRLPSRIVSADRIESYRRVRAYTTLLRPLAKYIIQAIPDDYLDSKVQTGTLPLSVQTRQISLIGDEVGASSSGAANRHRLGAADDDDDEDEDEQTRLEISPNHLWSHPSIPNGAALTWEDQAALLSNLVRFLSPTSAHLFQGLRTPPPMFAWKYESPVWPWPASTSESTDLAEAVLGRKDVVRHAKRSSLGIWRAASDAVNEARGYESTGLRQPLPSTIPENPGSTGKDEEPTSEYKGALVNPAEAHLRLAHQLHITALVLLQHASSLEQNVLLPVFEGASERKKDALRAAGLMKSEYSSATSSTPALGKGSADAVRRAEETMATAAKAAWALRRSFILRDVIEEESSASASRNQKAKKKEWEVDEEVASSREGDSIRRMLGRNVGPGMLARPPALAAFGMPTANPAASHSSMTRNGSLSVMPLSAGGSSSASSSSAPSPQLANGASTFSSSTPPSAAALEHLQNPKMSRNTINEIVSLGNRLFYAFLDSLPLLQKSGANHTPLRQAHDPRSNIISFSLPPTPSSSAQQQHYTTGADLDFGPMADAFVPALSDALQESLALVRRLFPCHRPKPQNGISKQCAKEQIGGQDVDVGLLKRVVEVVLMGEYVDGLMGQIAQLEQSSHGRGAGGAGLSKWVEDVQGKPPLSLRALPAAFTEAMRLPAILAGLSAANNASKDEEAEEKERARLRAEDVIYLAFESRMDTYLAQEREWVQRGMDRICARWNQSSSTTSSHAMGQNGAVTGEGNTDEAFLSSANPAAAKKSLLSSFKDVLLVPVSVVPRTANFVSGAVVNTFVPRRATAGTSANNMKNGGNVVEDVFGSIDGGDGGQYMDFSKGGEGPYGIGDDEDDDDDDGDEAAKKGAAEDDDDGYGAFSSSSATTATPTATTFSGADANEWASADHAIGPVTPTAVPAMAESPVKIVNAFAAAPPPELDEGWGEVDNSTVSSTTRSSYASSAADTLSTRPTSLARSTSDAIAAAGLSAPVSHHLSASGRTTPTPGFSSGRSTPQPPVQSRFGGSNVVPGRSGTPSGNVDHSRSALSRLQLLLSLDVALELIHLNRDTLKRIETFRGFPGVYGLRIRQEIEAIAVVFLQALSEKHLTPGLKEATEQVKAWIPAEHDASSSSKKKKQSKAQQDAIANARMGRGFFGAGSGNVEDGEADKGKDYEAVEPLVHFFELVHVGDAIQQMVQVYFDQELSRHVDRNDFLNVVVREKKRFESTLDENVAQGLNAGVDGLMGQVDYLMHTRQGPRDYYPESPEHMDLGNPTEACRDVVKCLKTHCSMLVGSTDKSVLEVFYQEVGLRLYALICKHLKRQIISIDGGFKVIADLNTYHAFVAAFLRQSQVTTYFDALKMLGNIYIIDHPRELAQIVRDANMFGGMLSPEELYEFLQARADFKSIEKAVDKEMYGFKVAEDCIIC